MRRVAAAGGLRADVSVATALVCLQGNVKKKKKGAWIKAALFKSVRGGERPFMVHFQANKQTQKCVTQPNERSVTVQLSGGGGGSQIKDLLT